MRKIRLTSLFTAMVLVACTVSFPGTAFAANSTISSPSTLAKVSKSLDNDGTYNSQSFETRGPKSFAIKSALRGISYMLRSGGKEFINKASKFLDKNAAKAVKQNTDFIANVIDDVAEIPDLAVHVVKEKLFYALKPLGYGNAMVISDAVAALVSAVVF